MGFILILLLAAFSASGVMTESEFTGSQYEYFKACYFSVVCTAKRPDEMMNVIGKMDQMMIDKIYTWFRDVSHYENAAHTLDFWESLPDQSCSKTEEEKTKNFYEFLEKIGENWLECCEDEGSECCIKMKDAEAAYTKMLKKYTLKKVCKSEAEIEASKAAEKGQESPLGGAFG